MITDQQLQRVNEARRRRGRELLSRAEAEEILGKALMHPGFDPVSFLIGYVPLPKSSNGS